MILDKRDVAIKSIRPVIVEHEVAEITIDQFQNGTLESILKLQDSIVFAQFKQYINKFKPIFKAYNQKSQRSYIRDVLIQDPRIRNSLIATFVSVMTLEEYSFYCANKIVANELIVKMLTARLQANTELLY